MGTDQLERDMEHEYIQIFGVDTRTFTLVGELLEMRGGIVSVVLDTDDGSYFMASIFFFGEQNECHSDHLRELTDSQIKRIFDSLNSINDENENVFLVLRDYGTDWRFEAQSYKGIDIHKPELALMMSKKDASVFANLLKSIFNVNHKEKINYQLKDGFGSTGK